MQVAFYAAATIALISTFLVVVSRNAVHALLYLVVSLLSVATIFFTLGAPFAGMLEIIVYAGAIMVLFIFVVMMLNLGERSVAQEREWMQPRAWIGPSVLSAALLGLMLWALQAEGVHPAGLQEVGPKQVGIVLYGPYLLVVEFGSMLLLAALVAAYHLGKQE